MLIKSKCDTFKLMLYFKNIARVVFGVLAISQTVIFYYGVSTDDRWVRARSSTIERGQIGDSGARGFQVDCPVHGSVDH